MPEAIGTSAALIASGEYVHSGVGPSSNSASAIGDTSFGTSGIDVSPFWQVGGRFELASASVLVEPVPIEHAEAASFELGATSIVIELVAAGLAVVGIFEFGSTSIAVAPVDIEDPALLVTPIGVEPVPVEAFAGSSFEFGVTPVSVFWTFLDLVSGGAGGRFELGATDIALTGVPLEYFQDFSPFEFGVAPIAVALVDADLYALPPATLAPSTTGLDLAPTTREFEPPRYAVTFERSMNGLSEAVLWGSKPGDAKMALGYKAVEDEWAEKWMQLYDTSREVSPLELPDEVYSGLSVGLKNIYSLAKYGLKWFFAGPPKIESVKEGFSAVDVDLEGRNATRLLYSGAGFLPPDPTIPVVITDIGDPYVPLPDGDVTDEDEANSTYVLIDDWADVAFEPYDPEVGPLQGASSRAEPGPSLARLDGTGFIVTGSYGLNDELPRTLHVYIRSLDLDGATSWTVAFELPDPVGGSIRPPSMAARRVGGGIVVGVRDDRREGELLSTVVRHTLVGCDEDGTNATVLASFTGAWSGEFAKNTPSGYVFYGRQTSSSSADVVIAAISEAFSVEATASFGSAWAPADCSPDPGGSGKLFFCGGNRVYCLNSDLSVSWARSFTGLVCDALKATDDGVLYVAGFDSSDVAFVLQLSALDGTTTSSCTLSITGGAYPYSLVLREDGGCLVNVEAYNSELIYGYSLYVGLDASLSIDYAIEVNAYGPDLGELNYCYPYGVPALSASHMILGMLTEYGIRENSCEGAGYLIAPIENGIPAASGIFGPDNKTSANSDASASPASLSGSSASLTALGGGTFTSTTPALIGASITVRSLVWGAN